MSLFGNATEAVIEQPTKDVISGAGNYAPIPSGIYKARIKKAYMMHSKSSQARGITIEYEIYSDQWDKPRKHTEQYWTHNQAGNNYYTNSNGTNSHLAGFNHMNDLCIQFYQRALNELTAEQAPLKSVPIYDFTKQQEVPQEVNVLEGFVEQDVALCLIHRVENKRKRDNNSGEYFDTNEKREFNRVDKHLFIVNNQPFTRIEIQNKETEPKIAELFLKKWEGQVEDKFTAVENAATSASKATTKPISIG